MKKALTISLAVVAVLAVGVYVFRGVIFDAISPLITADMFVASDDDTFDPGIPVGSTFPAIAAAYQGRTITNIGEFVGHRGLVVIANRSADW